MPGKGTLCKREMEIFMKIKFSLLAVMLGMSGLLVSAQAQEEVFQRGDRKSVV